MRFFTSEAFIGAVLVYGSGVATGLFLAIRTREDKVKQK